MSHKKQHVSRMYEKMRMLKALIDGGKISPSKLLELQVEYCYLQRKYELNTKR